MYRDSHFYDRGAAEVSMSVLVGVLRTRFLWLIGCTVIGAVMSVFFALSLPNIYSSKIVLAPSKSQNSQMQLSNGSGFSALAGLAGLGISNAADLSRAQLAEERIKAFSFFEDNLYEVMLPDLMAVETWNPDTATIVYDEKKYIKSEDSWIRKVEKPFLPKPTAQEAHPLFLAAISWKRDPSNGVITFSVKHRSPRVAYEWVSLVVDTVVEEIRDKDLATARKSIEVLEAVRSEVVIISVDEILASLIEEEIRKVAIARSSPNYVFEIIDRPIVADLKIGPQRAVICILGTVAGSLLALMFFLIWDLVIGNQSQREKRVSIVSSKEAV